MDGIIIVNKPKGWTSFDVVAKIRNLTGVRRVGHSGTLDPMATGLLVCLVNSATRLAGYAEAGAKIYAGTIDLGCTTSTDDLEGEVAPLLAAALNLPYIGVLKPEAYQA